MVKDKKFGKIYVVATPIGNLEDMSPRAKAVLGEVDLIAAEDTRHSKPLLNVFNIQTPCTSLHEHNETAKTDVLLERMKAGESIAIIADAGTPLISDPGFILIRRAQEAGITVIPIPGPCAAIAALSAAGLPADRFIFDGFLPAKTVARKKHLDSLRSESSTLIFYESTHRIMASLKDMEEIYGEDRQVVLAKELTKVHEAILNTTIKKLIAWLEEDPLRQKGEFVILVKGLSAERESAKTIDVEKTLKILLNELPLKQAVKLASSITGVRKNDVYQMALDM